MKKPISGKSFILALILGGILTGIFLRHNKTTWALIRTPIVNLTEKRSARWSSDFKEVKIKSIQNYPDQKAYFRPSSSAEAQPLVVSLHQWSGRYYSPDPLSLLCQAKDINYIHPDFRGTDPSLQNSMIEPMMDDLEDAIAYAINHGKVDTSNIYMIGMSGGGYATLCAFMRSPVNIKKFSAWVPVTDLLAWHDELFIRGLKYKDQNLELNDGEVQKINKQEYRDRSPMYWNTPVDKLQETKVTIYAGIYDGILGSIPISHSINFYNKLLSDLGVEDSSGYVSDMEKLRLLETRKPLKKIGVIGEREICLLKQHNQLKLVIFTGGHELLASQALDELLVQ